MQIFSSIYFSRKSKGTHDYIGIRQPKVVMLNIIFSSSVYYATYTYVWEMFPAMEKVSASNNRI